MQSMLDAGIATRRGIMCAHLEGAYAASSTPMPLSESERARDHCILLPLYAQMTEDEQRQVVAALHTALAAQKTLPMSARRTADKNHSPAIQAPQDRRVTLKTG
jgi:hypothetical protein